jgi:hypothetical protein
MRRVYLCGYALLETDGMKLYQCDIETALLVQALRYDFLRAYWPPQGSDGHYSDPTVVCEVEAPDLTHTALGLLPGVTTVNKSTRLNGMPQREAATVGDRVLELCQHVNDIDYAHVRRDRALYE